MNKDLEAFENRSDDWLAKERKREALVSAWDFDEGHRLKQEHRENCEAYEIKQDHEIKHKYYDMLNKQSSANKQFQDLNSNKTVKVLVPILLLSILFIFIGVFASLGMINGSEFGYVIPIVIFIIMVNLLPNKRRK